MKKQCKVVAKTTEITHEEWLEARGKGIGGSDAGTIASVNKYKSPLALWAEKTGKVRDDFEGNEATELGKLLELPIAEAYAKQTGSCVVAWPVILQSLEHPFMLANVDFLIMPEGTYPAGVVTVIDDLDEKPEAILEIKTAGLARPTNISAWRDNGVPASYEYQGLHYSTVTGVHKVIYAALIGGEGIVVRERNFEQGQCEALAELEKDFWDKVQNEVAPDPEGKASDFDTLKALYPSHVPNKAIDADEFQADLVAEYLRAKRYADEAQEVVDKVKSQMLELVGDAEEVRYNGATLYTYRSSKEGSTFDTKAFKEAHPELVAQFTKTRPGFRTLRIKEAN
jgi:putative phage-type endonuclease